MYLTERIVDPSGRDPKSHIAKICLTYNHETVNIGNFR